MRVESVTAEAVRPLRLAVLRPHQRPEEMVWPGDDADGALHVGARLDGGDDGLAGVATIAPEPHPRAPAPGDWRLRGMATVPEQRGRGIGAALLAACIDHARAHGGRRVWCNARTPARSFYERAGFVAEGDVFELPEIGPHVVMTLTLQIECRVERAIGL
jgi:GNAT superfamily N-acetyltransferase